MTDQPMLRNHIPDLAASFKLNKALITHTLFYCGEIVKIRRSSLESKQIDASSDNMSNP